MSSLVKLCRFASVRSVIAFSGINRSNAVRWTPATIRCFSDDTKSTTSVRNPVVRSQFVPISEDTATIILDVEEERAKLRSGIPNIDTEIDENSNEAAVDQYEGLNIERESICDALHLLRGQPNWFFSLCKSAGGTQGVFDIEDLVEVLRRDNAVDIFVCKVPAQLKYVDYICVTTARGPRHMKAIAEFVRRMYKKKRASTDLVPRLEGKGSDEWVALDMGNIALHIFSAEAREKYDIEQLWSVGAKFDAETNKPEDAVVQMFERHSVFLADLRSAKEPSVVEEQHAGGGTNKT